MCGRERESVCVWECGGRSIGPTSRNHRGMSVPCTSVPRDLISLVNQTTGSRSIPQSYMNQSQTLKTTDHRPTTHQHPTNHKSIVTPIHPLPPRISNPFPQTLKQYFHVSHSLLAAITP